MATLTNEQIKQKKQQLKQLVEEMSAITKELVEAGAIELSDDDLDKVSGGDLVWDGSDFHVVIPESLYPAYYSRYYKHQQESVPKEIPEPTGEPGTGFFV